MGRAARVVAAAKAFKPDLLLGLGGGSNMDVAKAAAAVLAHGGKAADYAGDQVVPGPVFPLILVPTTSGTGSEVTAAAVLADPDRGTKFGILSNYLRPSVAVVDPLLTVSCPPRVTAGSGIDALTHAVEAYTAIDNENFPLPAGERTVYQGRHPLADVLAQQAIELVGQHLRGAVADGWTAMKFDPLPAAGFHLSPAQFEAAVEKVGAVRAAVDVPLTVDTVTATVADRALDAGAAGASTSGSTSSASPNQANRAPTSYSPAV